MNKFLANIRVFVMSGLLTVTAFFPAQAQFPGHLFLFEDNMYTLMMNPSYMRDEGMIFGFPVFSGAAFGNISNFRLTDLIDASPENGPVIDLLRMYNRSNDRNLLAPGVSVPLFYAGIPSKKGMWSFYLKENFSAFASFPKAAFLWFENGNVSEEFRNYQSGSVDAHQLGYLEAAAGLTVQNGSKLTWGIRGKVLFGRSFVNLENWDFGIRTNTSGSEVTFLARGDGSFSLPFNVLRNESNRIYQVETSEAGKYLVEFGNPGFALDAAISTEVGENNLITIGLSDAGMIWFRKGTYDIPHDEAYRFKGMNISDVFGSVQGKNYVSPLELMINTKDSLRNVFRPVGNPVRQFQPVIPKMFVHFKRVMNQTLSLGITNQIQFFRKQPVNVLTGTLGVTKGNFVFAGGPTLFGISSLKAGGGLQWNYGMIRLFVMTDNLSVFYHPGNQRAYSLTFGMNLLTGAKNGHYNSFKYRKTGITEPHRPFYRKKR